MLIVEKLLEVQVKLNAPKNQRNSFGNYNYRSCEDIIEAVKPILAEQKLSLTISDSIEYIGNRYYVRAEAKVTDCENGTDISVCAYAREEETKKGMDSAQITGSTSSYARKYALNGLFAIDDSKDPDTDEYKKSVDAKAGAGSRQGLTDEQAAKIEQELERTGIKADVILKTYGVKTIKDIERSKFESVINKFKKTPDRSGK